MPFYFTIILRILNRGKECNHQNEKRIILLNYAETFDFKVAHFLIDEIPPDK